MNRHNEYPCIECRLRSEGCKYGWDATKKPCKYPVRKWWKPGLWAAWLIPLSKTLREERAARVQAGDWPEAFLTASSWVRRLLGFPEGSAAAQGDPRSLGDD